MKEAKLNDITLTELARWGAIFQLERGAGIYVWARNADSDEMAARMKEAGFDRAGMSYRGTTLYFRPLRGAPYE